jgi:hypothetical protein
MLRFHQIVKYTSRRTTTFLSKSHLSDLARAEARMMVTDTALIKAKDEAHDCMMS